MVADLRSAKGLDKKARTMQQDYLYRRYDIYFFAEYSRIIKKSLVNLFFHCVRLFTTTYTLSTFRFWRLLCTDFKIYFNIELFLNYCHQKECNHL
jgi:hypothetical protein